MLSLFFSAGIFYHSTVRVVQYLCRGCRIESALLRPAPTKRPKQMTGTMKLLIALIAIAIIAICGNDGSKK